MDGQGTDEQLDEQEVERLRSVCGYGPGDKVLYIDTSLGNVAPWIRAMVVESFNRDHMNCIVVRMKGLEGHLDPGDVYTIARLQGIIDSLDTSHEEPEHNDVGGE